VSQVRQTSRAQLQLNQKLIACRSSKHILELCSKSELAEWSHVNLITALHRTASLNDGHLELYKILPLTESIEAVNLARLEPRHLANIAWAVARLTVPDSPLVSALDFEARLTEFKPQELSNITWSIAQLSLRNQPVIEALAVRAPELLS